MITKMVLSCCDKKWIVKESDNRKMLMGDTNILYRIPKEFERRINGT